MTARAALRGVQIRDLDVLIVFVLDVHVGHASDYWNPRFRSVILDSIGGKEVTENTAGFIDIAETEVAPGQPDGPRDERES